jgi:hypothetical protein
MHALDSNYLLPPGYQESSSNGFTDPDSSFLEVVPGGENYSGKTSGQGYTAGFVVSLIILGAGIVGLVISAFGICYLRRPKSLLVFKESELATMMASSS